MKLVVDGFLFTAVITGLLDTTVSQNLPPAATRAAQTLQGLFDYYWTHDPASKDIAFFFACGQIGGWGKPQKWTQCGCSKPAACKNCYRWWDAVILESIATHSILTNSTMYSAIAEQIFRHSPYNSNWNATADCTFIDDFSWYIMAYLRVYEWLKEPVWLNRTLSLYDWTWKNGWHQSCGGFWWSNCEEQLFKDSITIVEVLFSSSKLSLMFPDQSRYLTDAQMIWDWIFSFDNGHGLMSDQYLMSTGAVPERCCNATHNNSYTKCHNSRIPGTSYNQGLLMSSSAYLYRRTGDKKYLNVGLKALEAVLQNYTTRDGVLMDEPRAYQTYDFTHCWGGVDPGGDWYSFNGIFMLHLSYFVELLVEIDSIPFFLLNDLKTLVELSSNAAWTKSIVHPPFNQSDVCNTNGPSPKSSAPKFHWWWEQDLPTHVQKIPPDPRYLFHKSQLRCAGNDTQLWEGMTYSEKNCTSLCRKNPNCSKYLYQTDQSAVPGTDCWIWSYNRSNHLCYLPDTDFNVGIKRPIGNATCAGRCGSKEPQRLDTGVCYCDPECTKYLDCCLDYANHCLPPGPITCNGLCNVVEPRAIPGGGYCWCTAGCNPWYTDNNSDGSCCPDYHLQCLKQTMPVCLDARSQGSALNLFLAHMKTSSL